VAIPSYFSISASVKRSHVDSVRAKAAMCSFVIWSTIPLKSPAFCFSRIRAVVPSNPASSQMNASFGVHP
jgi:hypothetical protein